MNAPGDVVDGRFELIERLGSGGMGTVWRARDAVLHREVALKAVRPDAGASDAVRERVLREARALARLSHPHVVTVHHIVDADPHPWIVMELVPGTSLQQRLDAEGPLPPSEAASIGRQILSALRAAHTAGIQHRDVKPANVLLRPDGTAVLTDFGIAALQGTTALTVTGELVGSPEYMAPERIRGHADDDPASDLWSLGLVLYVCVEGVSPLRRATTLATLAAVLDDPLPPPVRSGPLEPVLHALLVRDPAARPDAQRLDAMLAEVGSGATPHWAQPTQTAPVPPPVAGPAPTRRATPPPYTDNHPRARSRTTIAVAVTAVLAIATATTLFLTLRDPGDGTPATGGAPGSSTTTQTPSRPGTAPTPSPTPTPTPSAKGSPTASATTPPPPTGQWIAQLFSEPVGSGTAARDIRFAKIRKSVPEARMVRSDKYASLRPGYWVIYAPGPFAGGRAALAFCAERGRTTANTCIGRYLSTNAADSVLQCRPPATAPTGRCTRPQ
ncbi:MULTISPECIES: serine/threonine-protein kinase [Streptomyces]|uniref:non-specific serine/threonine protein kinase n=1 Tax=Streptomyces dengpaensis TaxID=2049881 RepID=A0ABN5I6Y1_9ACTN|nr:MULTISPECIES: serine/threonine-protein kinase [Streptomyces]AVH58894.1 serine/threonine protein kinase [Streptomyces dengpaensis]PIB11057.1 serine/threonine protein kinase [Streptomyces sp. HG99]